MCFSSLPTHWKFCYNQEEHSMSPWLHHVNKIEWKCDVTIDLCTRLTLKSSLDWRWGSQLLEIFLWNLAIHFSFPFLIHGLQIHTTTCVFSFSNYKFDVWSASNTYELKLHTYWLQKEKRACMYVCMMCKCIIRKLRRRKIRREKKRRTRWN